MQSKSTPAPAPNNEYQLLLHKLLSQTIYRHSPNEVVYGNKRETWPKLYERAMRLASGLRDSAAISRGAKVAVIDFDTSDYLEAYYAVPSIQAVLHTVNIRLPPEQIVYTMAHAEDEAVLIRDEFLPMLAKLAPNVKSLKKIIVMSDSGSMPAGAPWGSYFFDDLVNDSDQSPPEEFDE